jgi:hypothetical protein
MPTRLLPFLFELTYGMDLFVTGRDNSAADLSRFVVDLKERHLENWIP